MSVPQIIKEGTCRQQHAGLRSSRNVPSASCLGTGTGLLFTSLLQQRALSRASKSGTRCQDAKVFVALEFGEVVGSPRGAGTRRVQIGFQWLEINSDGPGLSINWY